MNLDLRLLGWCSTFFVPYGPAAQQAGNNSVLHVLFYHSVFTDFTDGGPGLFDDLVDEGSSSNLLSPASLLSPPVHFIRRESIHGEYDVLPEELGRY